MTTLDAAAHMSTTATRWSDGIALPVATLARRLGDWNDARLTRRALSRLSSHELDDIGLCRGDIDGIGRR